MSLTLRRSLGLLGALTILVAACSTAASPSPTVAPSGAPSGAPTSVPTEAPSAAPAEQTLVYLINGDIQELGNATDDVPTQEFNQFITSGLYAYDASITPVPWLAADLAALSEGGKVWTITLRDGLKFDDGSDLTSADVVNSYLLGMSPNCRYNPDACITADELTAVEALDAKTIKFTLPEPMVTFGTTVLPAIVIESKAAIAASYAKYKELTSAVTAEESKALTDKLAAIDAAAAAAKTDADYSPLEAEMTAFLQKAGQQIPDKAAYTGEDGTVDPTYFAELATLVRTVEAQFSAPAIDALAAAYPYLDFMKNPVEAGPYKVESIKTAEQAVAVANPYFFRGTPQISKIYFPVIKDDIAGGQALKAGQVDWMYTMEGPTYTELKDAANLQFATYPEFGHYELQVNMREGTLFGGLETGRPLRQALAWCIDKQATVDAANDGQAVAVYSDIPPASWAYPSEGLETYQPRDVAKAKALIEGAGWTMGSDGIYEKNGVKLATVVTVRAERPARSKYMALLSEQVKECGMNITYKELDFASVQNMINVYPHINAADPASGKPFDLYFGGWGVTPDPDPYSLFYSGECSTAERPLTFNYICYQNPEVDKLILAGRLEFDQAKRAEIYKQYAILQAKDLPYIYAWSAIEHEGLAKTIGSTAEGGLVLDNPYFFWEVERLTNIK
jgi:ABC-type transport system substrate-binding protein